MEHINNAKIFQELKKRDTKSSKRYIEKLELLEQYLIPEYEKIRIYFSQYTDHGWGHTIQVLDYMYDLICNPERLTEEELMIIIFSALLHDIGMACTENEVKDLIPDVSLENKERITDVIRAKHGKFAEKKIKQISRIDDPQSLKDVFKLYAGATQNENWDLTNYIATISRSHTESVYWVQTEFADDSRGLYIACLLRLADLLDIDSNRANDFYRASYRIEGRSGNHYVFNQIVGDSNKIKICEEAKCLFKCINEPINQCCENPYKRIELTITFPIDLEHTVETTVRNMISDYIEEIECEICRVKNCLNKLDRKFHIKLFSDVNCVYTPIYSSSNSNMHTQKLSIDYSEIKSILSNERLYPNKLYGIREIVQNAYDACKAYAELKSIDYDWEPKITIKYDKINNKLIICDNGIGMTEFVIKEYFLNIGKSIYNHDSAYLYDNYHKDHIGHFGLGFFAAFMLSEKIDIRTKPVTSTDKSTKIELNRSNNYATLSNGDRSDHGTDVILNFDEVMKSLDIKTEEECLQLVRQYIQDTFIFDEIKICFTDSSLTKELKLKKVSEHGGEPINQYLMEVDAKINVDSKQFPPIFYANSSDDLSIVDYEELLKKLSKTHQSKNQIPYIDAGSFFVFPGNEKIESDFLEKASSLNPRINYSLLTDISDSIEIKVNEFCNVNHLDKTTHGDYRILDLIVEDNNAVLYEKNIHCAKNKTIMRKYDACGKAQLDDFVYLRDVYLPHLHISLPFINFRYEFNGLLANIKTDDIFPTLTRELLSNERTRDISTAIGYAVLQLKINNKLNLSENELLLKYTYKDLDSNIFIRKG